VQLTLIRVPEAGSPGPVPDGPGRLRPIGEADLEAVGRLYAASYPTDLVGDEAAAVEDIRASWAGEYGTWLHEASLLVELGGQPVAAVLTVDRPPWDDVADLAFVIDLFTHPDHRGRGLAGRLVRAALAAVGPDRVVGLRVESDNGPAVRLYRRLGFRDRP
jgi:ribosomal protein S18 acetylase RimI-like enzyme